MTVVEEKENFEENKMRDIRERFSRGGIFGRARQWRGAEMYIYLKSLGKPFSYHYNWPNRLLNNTTNVREMNSQLAHTLA